MTLGDWPRVHPRLEVKASESWLEHHGSIEVLSRDGDGSPWEPIALTEEFPEVDFGAVIPLLLPSDGFDFAPYNSFACGRGGIAMDVNSGAIMAMSLGFLLGLTHATDADHGVAVSTIASEGSYGE